MVTFKPKTDKKITQTKKTVATLDETHRTFMAQFQNNEQVVIPKLNEQRKNYLEKKHELSNHEKSEKYTTKIIDINMRIRNIDNKIRAMKNEKSKYLLENAKYIFEYFEAKQNISVAPITDSIVPSVEEVPAPAPAPVPAPADAISIFFKGNSVKSSPTYTTDSSQHKLQGNNTSIHKYLNNVNKSLLNMELFVQNISVCSVCNLGELIPLEDDGVVICNSCGVNSPYLVDGDKQSYKEPPKEICFYAYKRINHFKEILLQFQGKETIHIPPNIMEDIRNQIKKERVIPTQLSYERMKNILKKLSLTFYYEHNTLIRKKFGVDPPDLSLKTTETLLNLFGELQGPYAKHVPDYRINFLNHYYALYKLCELLGETLHVGKIPMLKDRGKIIEQDDIWKKMCDELDWKYIPTM